MFGPKELDQRNVYNPNLQDIAESSERTYGEANSFYRKEELYLKDVERRILSGELVDEKEIYDECHAIASDLAKCCEMYLKALYIYENNTPGNNIDALWDKLKNSEFMCDEHGYLIYETSRGEITFVRYDNDGNPIKDSNGKLIYYDKNGNVYNENSRGSKIKRNGHQLDRLIELLSQESRLMLEMRMLTIPMESTENNSSVSFVDVLLKKGVITQDKQMSSEQYNGWIDKHKKTFEESRYSGQKQYDINVEFLYHLATQIKAVAQYNIDPKNNQKFTIPEEDYKKLPIEIQKLASSHSNLMTENLLTLLINNEEARKKFSSYFSQKYYIPIDIKSKDFCRMFELMDEKEILYTSYLCYVVHNRDKINSSYINDIVMYDLATMSEMMNWSSGKIISFLVYIKDTFKVKIGGNNFVCIINYLKDYSVGGSDGGININKYIYNDKNTYLGNIDNINKFNKI